MQRSQRLRRPTHFRRVREAGSRWSNRLLALSAAPNRTRSTRVGIVVGRHLGGAVVRNRLKRRTREVVRRMYGQLQPGWDVVFVIRTAVARASHVELQQAITQLLRQARLLRSPEPAASTSPTTGEGA